MKSWTRRGRKFNAIWNPFHCMLLLAHPFSLLLLHFFLAFTPQSIYSSNVSWLTSAIADDNIRKYQILIFCHFVRSHKPGRNLDPSFYRNLSWTCKVCIFIVVCVMESCSICSVVWQCNLSLDWILFATKHKKHDGRDESVRNTKQRVYLYRELPKYSNITLVRSEATNTVSYCGLYNWNLIYRIRRAKPGISASVKARLRFSNCYNFRLVGGKKVICCMVPALEEGSWVESYKTNSGKPFCKPCPVWTTSPIEISPKTCPICL